MTSPIIRMTAKRILTEYECGRAQLAIEWVARSQKPIVEIGGRPVKDWSYARKLVTA